MLTIKKTNYFLKWFGGLKNKDLIITIERRIERMEIDGYIGKTYPIVGFKGLSEIKIEVGKGYRIYFNLYVKGNEVWLLNGGDKSTQDKDIKVAEKLLKEIEKQRKETENGRDYNYGR